MPAEPRNTGAAGPGPELLLTPGPPLLPVTSGGYLLEHRAVAWIWEQHSFQQCRSRGNKRAARSKPPHLQSSSSISDFSISTAQARE